MIHLASGISPSFWFFLRLSDCSILYRGCGLAHTPSGQCPPANFQLSTFELFFGCWSPLSSEAWEAQNIKIPNIYASWDHLPTKDWQQLVSKYSSFFSLWKDNLEACILYWLTAFSREIKPQLCTMINWLDKAPLLAAFPSLSLVLILLLVFLGVTSQVNYLYWNTCFRVYFWGNSN